MGAKKSRPKNDAADVIERILGARSVLTLDLNDVGIVVGDRKFSFSGKLTVGPVSFGKKAK